MGQRCQGKHYNDEPCLREVIDESGWCLFHHPKPNLKYYDVFKEAFEAELARQKHIHSDYLDFTGFVFPIEMDFDEMTFPTVYFTDVIFKKDVRFTPDRFKYFGEGGTQSGCQFKGKAFFSGVKFKGTSDFLNATFFSDAIFSRAEFTYDAHFTGVHFIGKANFSSTRYNYLTFSNSEFESQADFYNATFTGEDTSFNGTIFHGNASFWRTDFWGETYFNWILFEADADFRECKFVNCGFYYTIFKGLTTLRDIYVNGNMYLHDNEIHSRLYLDVKEWRKLDYLPFRDDFVYTSVIQVRDPIFHNNGKMIIEGSMGEISKNLLVGLSLQYTDLDNISLIDVEWPRLKKNGRKASVDELIITLGRDYLGKDLKTGTPDSVAQLYRTLRDKYEKEKRYHEAGDFFRAEMDVKRKYTKSKADRVLLTVYNELARYGESIGLPILWSFLFIIFSTTLITLQEIHPRSIIDFLLSAISRTLPKVLMAFYPFGSANDFQFFLIKIVGSLLIGTIFIATRRKLERR